MFILYQTYKIVKVMREIWYLKLATSNHLVSPTDGIVLNFTVGFKAAKNNLSMLCSYKVQISGKPLLTRFVLGFIHFKMLLPGGVPAKASHARGTKHRTSRHGAFPHFFSVTCLQRRKMKWGYRNSIKYSHYITSKIVQIFPATVLQVYGCRRC